MRSRCDEKGDEGSKGLVMGYIKIRMNDAVHFLVIIVSRNITSR